MKYSFNVEKKEVFDFMIFFLEFLVVSKLTESLFKLDVF